MADWQKIETAPTDGTRIIVGASGFPSTTAFYCQPGSCVWWTGWAEGGNRSDMYGPGFEPTHWMPLPAPPTDNEVSSPRPTDCAAIQSGEVTVLARDAEGNAVMTMRKA